MSDKEILHIGNLDQIYKEFNLIAPKNAKRIIEIFENNKSEILIPGGFVRDVLLKKIPHDIDFATNLKPNEIENLLTKELDGNYKKLELQGKIFGVIRIIMNNNECYEIATFRKDSVYGDGIHPDNIEIINNAEEDAIRRDFTINALFYNPINGDVIDYVGGLKDIKEKKLCFVGNANLRIGEDKSRMLRYVRFLLLTNFSPNDDDIKIIKNHANKIQDIPKELLKKELDKIINITNPKTFLETLDKLNLLENIFPEIKSLEKCEQGAPYHMEGNVLIHTKMVCENIPDNSDLILKWAAIFHDIGKPETRKLETKDNVEKTSFINHDNIGASKTKSILKLSKFSKKEIQEITWIIENHIKIFMQMFDIIEKGDDEISKQKCINIIKKLIHSYSEKQVARLMALTCADSKSSIYQNGNYHTKYLNKIFEFFDLTKKEIQNDMRLGINISKIVDGKIIIEKLNITPGKNLGIIKQQIIDELSDQKFNSLEEAQNAFLNILNKFKS